MTGLIGRHWALTTLPDLAEERSRNCGTAAPELIQNETDDHSERRGSNLDSYSDSEIRARQLWGLASVLQIDQQAHRRTHPEYADQ